MQVNYSASQLSRLKKENLGAIDGGKATLRFPPVDGVQQKVSLVTSRDGIFYNIAFTKDTPNEISGNMADKLLMDFKGVFRVVMVNGETYFPTREEEIEHARLKKIAEIESNQRGTDNQKPTARSREKEKELLGE
jgi:hypothetical protein